MQSLEGFAPCLRFDSQAEEAANFYCAIFPNSRITGLTRYGNEGKEIHGGEQSNCGWVTDRFGLSWQVVPSVLHEILRSPDRARADRAMKAMLQMKKLDIATLQEAYDG